MAYLGYFQCKMQGDSNHAIPVFRIKYATP